MLGSPSQSIRLSVYKSSCSSASPHAGRAEGTPMHTPASLCTNKDGPSPPLPPPLVAGDEHEAGEQQAISVDSDTVVILASLLCALICVAGLALVARCTCRRPRQGSGGGSGSGPTAAQAPPRGLKKAAIEALLPTVSLEGGDDDERECAICLAVFTKGDELRVLPRCGHGFHAACIDTWLAAHASCPSCRAIIVACRRCGAACGDLIGVATTAAGQEHPPPLHPSLPPEGEGTHAIELVIH